MADFRHFEYCYIAISPNYRPFWWSLVRWRRSWERETFN